VELRSHRTLLGADVAAALASQTGYGSRAIVDIRNALIAQLVTQIEPGKSDAQPLDGTVEAVLAQRADDYGRLYNLATDAYQLTVGTSIIPDVDEWEDPTPPTGDGSEPRSDSAVPSPS
jgi:hypothetical protein